MATAYTPAWKAVLSAASWPTDVVVLDFETYFDEKYSMRGGDQLSTVEFIRDNRFEATGLAWLVVPGQSPFLDYEHCTKWAEGEAGVQTVIDHLKRTYGTDLRRCVVVSHNARFDMSVLAHHYGLHPKWCIDTLGLARHWNSRQKNSLDVLTKQYGLPEKGNTADFKGLSFRPRYTPAKPGTPPKRRPAPTDEQRAALGDYAVNDVKREWELFTLLLPKLSNPAGELWCMQHTLELFTRPMLRVDHDLAADLIRRMEHEVDSVCGAAGVSRKQAGGTIEFNALLADALDDAGDNLGVYLKPGKKGSVLAFAKDDYEREVLLAHKDDTVRRLCTARAAVKSWPAHIKRIQRIERQARANDGVLPVPLTYCGAHTGRWSGGERINLQNLGSRGHALINATRNLLIAPPGHTLVIADASQIEARVLAWVADQKDLVTQFAEGREIYCRFASKVLGLPVRKPREGGVPEIEAWHKWARNSIGKIGVLGCGYGMGPEKTVAYAKGAIDAETGEKIVSVYRAENRSIVSFWRSLEKAFSFTGRYKRPCSLPHGLHLYSRSDCDVVIVLPGGRELKYHRVRVTPGKYGPECEVFNPMKKSWGRVWGGHLTENVVQAVSRDILEEAVHFVEYSGHRVVHHIHDEVVLCVPEDAAPNALDTALMALRRVPEWGSGLPLDAEGLITPRYGGH